MFKHQLLRYPGVYNLKPHKLKYATCLDAKVFEREKLTQLNTFSK